MKLKPYLKSALFVSLAIIFSQCSPPPAAPQYHSERATAGSQQVPLLEAEAVSAARRPGLGTGWGERVESEIQYTNFHRKNAKPSSVQSIYYNDKQGVDAMIYGWSYSTKGLQKSSDGLVEWGVKSGWGYAKNVHSAEKRFVIGKQDSRYSLVVKNICESRLEVVLSVDGLDVMDGKPASVKKRGYIVMPQQTLTVKGFRTSEEAVAAFKFSTVDSSYSNLKHGTTRNVGVIGMAIYTEKGTSPWRYRESELRERKEARAFAEAPLIRAR